jgi:hypothetical protein
VRRQLTSLSMCKTYESVGEQRRYTRYCTIRYESCRCHRPPSIHALTFQFIPSTLEDIAASHSTHLYLATGGQYNFPLPIPPFVSHLRFGVSLPSSRTYPPSIAAKSASHWLGTRTEPGRVSSEFDVDVFSVQYRPPAVWLCCVVCCNIHASFRS